MIIFRPHRGSLAAAMAEAVEVDSVDALMRAILNSYDHIALDGDLEIKPYSDADDRIGWKQTCIVLLNGSPVGFTNGAF